MERYIENHILRKLKLIDSLYFTHKKPSVNYLADVIGASEQTVRKYLKDYNLTATQLNDGHMCREDRLTQVNRILSESLFNKTLYLLITHPGKQADYYSDQLAISTVNFYKTIRKLNKFLSGYHAQTVVRDGYHIVAKDERMFRIALFFFMAAFNTENSQLIKHTQSLLPLLSRFDIKFTYHTFHKSWGKRYLGLLLWVNCVRQSRSESAIDVSIGASREFIVNMTQNDIVSVQSMIPRASKRSLCETLLFMKELSIMGETRAEETQVESILGQYAKDTGIYITQKQKDTYEGLKRMVAMGCFLSNLFPYDVNGYILSVKDFYTEYAMINHDFIENFDFLIQSCSKVTQHNFEHYKELLFYVLMHEHGEPLLLPLKKILIVCSDSTPTNHLNSSELSRILSIIKVHAEFSQIHEREFKRECHCTEYDLIISEVRLCQNEKIIQNSFHNTSHIAKTILDYFRTV